MINCKLSENMVDTLDYIGKHMGISREDSLKKCVALLKIINDISIKEDDYQLIIETKSGKKYKIELK